MSYDPYWSPVAADFAISHVPDHSQCRHPDLCGPFKSQKIFLASSFGRNLTIGYAQDSFEYKEMMSQIFER